MSYYLGREFEGYELTEAEHKQKPTPGYRVNLRSESGLGHNFHFSNPFLQDNTPEEAVSILEFMALEVTAKTFPGEDVVVLINNDGITVLDL